MTKRAKRHVRIVEREKMVKELRKNAKRGQDLRKCNGDDLTSIYTCSGCKYFRICDKSEAFLFEELSLFKHDKIYI